jgi:hypothetical protein
MLDVVGTNDGTIVGFRAQPIGRNMFGICMRGRSEQWPTEINETVDLMSSL